MIKNMEFPLNIEMVEYNFETLINQIYKKHNIKLPSITNVYKRTCINLKSKNINFDSSLGSLILEKLNEKLEYTYSLLRQSMLNDEFPLYIIKNYLLSYAYIDFYNVEENLRALMYEKYAGSKNFGYEPNYYIKMHMQDIIELEKMNLLDSFCEIELEIMNMICINEQKNLNFIEEAKILTKK